MTTPQRPIGATPVPRLSPMWFDNAMHLVERIWEQWFVGLIACVNRTPGNSVPVVFADLPDPVEGMLLVVTDSTVNTWGTAIVIGGGGLRVLAYYNGTNWTVAAK